MELSAYTKRMLKYKKLFNFLQFFCMFIVTVVYIVAAASGNTAPTTDLQSQIGVIAYSMAITIIVLVCLLCLVGHKVRTTIWMANVILGAYLFGTNGMYLTFGIWLFDEYVLYNLYTHYKTKATINKEIDKRG